MSKRWRLSWLGMASLLPAIAGLLALLEWDRRREVASAGEHALDGSGVALFADDLPRRYGDPQAFDRLCAAVQEHYDALVGRSLRLQHLRKSRTIEFDRRNQPITVVESLERVHFEGRKECVATMESRQVIGSPPALLSGGSPGGLDIKAPFSGEPSSKGLYRYRLEGVEEVDRQFVLRVHFEPIRPAEGSFKGSVWVDPTTAEPVRMHGSAVKLPIPLDRLEMLIDYGPAENGHNQMRRVTVEVAGGFAFVSKHYRIEAELSDYRPREP